MIDPDLVTQATDEMFDTRDSSVTSIFVAATPNPKIRWFSLQGFYDMTKEPKKPMEHRSKIRKEYPVSIPVARLNSNVKNYGARATVTMGTFRLIGEMGTWKTWGIEDVKVQENLQSHDVTVDFNLVLDSESVGVESFS